jgi:hypothetical protein
VTAIGYLATTDIALGGIATATDDRTVTGGNGPGIGPIVITGWFAHGSVTVSPGFTPW